MSSLDSTLTTPSDRKGNTIQTLNGNAPVLTDDQTKLAMQELNQTAYVQKFPQVERRFADPPVDLQKIGLFSFVPAVGAKPNEQGLFGFAKLRGNFATEHEANLQAEKIVREVDSYHQIYHTYVGRPFPVTLSSEFSKEVERVDIRKEMSQSISADVKEKREKEQREIEEIKQREKELLEDVSRAEEPTDD
jgi:hypothetical protein